MNMMNSKGDVSAQPDRFIHDGLSPVAQWPVFQYPPSDDTLYTHVNVVVELLDKACTKGWGDRPLLRSPEIVLSYANVLERVNQIAQVLTEDFKLVPGNRVLLRGANSIDLCLSWLAVVKAGLIAVSTMPLLRVGELGEVIAKAQPCFALCDIKLMDDLLAAQSQHPVLQTIVPFNTLTESTGLASRAAQKDGRFEACNTAGSDVALLAFTSGTTGKPKAPIHTHADLLAACEAWPRHVLQATPEDIVMGSPPLAFTFGLGGLLVFPMWAGSSVYFPDVSYTPERMVKLMNEVGATICYTAPTFYRQMAPFVKLHGLPKLRISVSAGETLPDATRQLWKEATGLQMLDGIGATEMFHIFISSAGNDVKAGAIGKVVPGYTAKVVDDAGNEVPHGTLGKLAVIGPTGCRYFDDTRQINYVKHGWNFPGDIFTQDVDGYFYYQARDDDMIITAGYNVGAPEVEDALLKHASVLECAVIGQKDDERGMVVRAFVVLKPAYLGNDTMVKTLQDHVKAVIAPYKYPRIVNFVDKLPRTETGKLQRFKLRQENSI